MRLSVVTSALVACLVGFGSTLAVIVEATRRLGATPQQTSSWICALCLGMAATSAFLSTRYRMPIVTAWSLAGAVLLAAAPEGTSMGEGIGAAMLAAALTVLAGIVPALGRGLARLPASIAGGMLAGLLLRFAIDLIGALHAMPAVVGPLLLLFLILRRLHAASAPLGVIVAAGPVAALAGMALPPFHPALSTLVWMPPRFTLPALLGLGLPLFLVTMATQQISGAAVLRLSGYRPPVTASLVTTGLATLLLAPFGAYSVNLSSITAAICTGPDAHPDKAQRWRTGPVYAACYAVLALFGASLASLLTALPPPLVAAVAGVAMLQPLTYALGAGLREEGERFAATLTFAITASGLTAGGLGAAFWGLLAGLLVLGLERIGRTQAVAGTGLPSARTRANSTATDVITHANPAAKNAGR